MATAILHIALTFIVALHQVRGETEGEHSIEKRHVSALARLGQLPHQGKRYVAALARNGDLMPYLKPSWSKKFRHSLEDLEERLEGPQQDDQYTKRYVGALAKSGDLRLTREEKRDDFDSLIYELITAEELKRLRLDALQDELFREKEEQAELEEDPDGEKRTLSLDGKRNLVSLARSGYLKSPTAQDTDDDGFERDLYSNEEFLDIDSLDKRGGISSLAKNGYSFPKRTMDDDLEELMNEVYGIDDKRNVASLARGYNFPTSEKKNIGSFLRSGGLSGLTHMTKKDDDWNEYGEDKRNLPSLLRDRSSPIGEGKRHIGSIFKNSPAFGPTYPDKKNMGALARNRDFPFAYRLGKRDKSDEIQESEEMSKRYVAALLRQGRLPVGIDSINSQQSSDTGDDNTSLKEDSHSSEERKDENSQISSEENGFTSMRKKKSITAEDQMKESAASGDTNAHSRSKRETFPPVAGEYLLPVLQNSGFNDFVDSEDKYVDDITSPINKRYFAVRGGGKIPGGRLPTIGRSRSRHMNAGRRRH